MTTKAKEKTTPVSAEVVVEPKQSTEIVTTENQNVNFDAQSLVELAINQKVPVETMERLLAMAEKMQAIKAKQEFDKAMAKFQSECPTIVKTKEVHTKSGALAYRYAPIESIVEQVKDALNANGFSYSTTMEVLPAGVRVQVKVTHTAGHSEITPMEVPLGERTQIMSASQVTAAASTFAKRYAFCNAFGILTGDEDTDASKDSTESEPKKPYTPPAPKMVNGKPVYEKSIKPSEKQLELIGKLCNQKGYTKEDILDLGFTKLTGGKEGTASELIDYLMKAQPKIKPSNGEPMPVIQQGTEIDEKTGAIIDKVTGEVVDVPF